MIQNGSNSERLAVLDYKCTSRGRGNGEKLVKEYKLSFISQFEGPNAHHGDCSEQYYIMYLKFTKQILNILTTKKISNCEVINVLTSLIVVNISQCIHISNYHVIYLKLTQCSLSVVSLRLMEENKAKKYIYISNISISNIQKYCYNTRFCILVIDQTHRALYQLDLEN